MQVSIRFEEPADAPGVRETNEQAFGAPLEARLVDALRGSAGSISLVATMADLVIGHILFTRVIIEPPARVRVAGLAPMSVRPEHQRAGVGGLLLRAGLDECRRIGYSAVVVLGHPTYYPRFGFRPADAWGLQCEFSVPREAFMAIELEPAALAMQAGVVRYAPEFAMFSRDE